MNAKKTETKSSGARTDGRKSNEHRKLVVKAGIIPRADGSGYVEFGKTHAIAAVYGPKKMHPAHLQNVAKGTLRYTYNMLSFSVTERIRPGPSRRSTEISMVTRQALVPVIFLEEFPRTTIDVHIEVLQADASTRCVGINAASIALADAGVPMADLISSCSAGIVENHILLDVAGKEDTEGQLDLPIAYYKGRKEITLLQMDGLIERKKLREIIELAVKGCEEVYDAQAKAIKEKYSGDNE